MAKLINLELNVIDNNFEGDEIAFKVVVNKYNYKDECDFLVTAKVGDIHNEKVRFMVSLIYNEKYCCLKSATKQEVKEEFLKHEIKNIRENILIINQCIKNLYKEK